MIEIRIHGRGGQGGVTTGQLVAISAFNDNKFSQTFPVFGVERCGAPVEAYARIDEKQINLHSQVYTPDVVLVLDSSLMKTVDVTKGLKDNGIIIINTNKSKKELNLHKGNHKVYTIDATKIALDTIHKPIMNTPLLGAFAKITGLVTLNSLKKAVDERFNENVADFNKKSLKQYFIRLSFKNGRKKNIPITTGAVISEPGNSIKNKTGNWRTLKPIKDKSKCTQCGLCWLYCPETAIDEKFEIDYDYCKGCGICAKECPFGAIHMEKEEK